MSAFDVVRWNGRGSRLGRALAALREDELAARAMGVDVSRYRVTAFVTSGAVAGMYGVLISYFSRFITPDDFGFAAAVDGLVTAVVGGSLMFIGPLLGSGFLTSVPEIQRALGVEAGWIRPFLASALLLVVILFLPGGLSSLIPRWCAPEFDPDATPPDLPALPSAGTPLLSLSGVGKDYGGVHAVKAIDLELHSGEGARPYRPQRRRQDHPDQPAQRSGNADQRDGQRPRCPLGGPGRAHRFAKAGVSRTFQHSKLFDRLTVLENALVGAHVVSRPTPVRPDQRPSCGGWSSCPRRVATSTGRWRRPARSWPGWASRTGRGTPQDSCRTATGAGWRSPVPSRGIRPCSSLTSPSRA